MNEAYHNYLNHLKSTSNTSTEGWPVKEFVVTGKPDDNRAIIDYTRDKKHRAFMEKNADDKSQLYIQDHGFLEPFDVVSFFEDGTYKVGKC